ncbi:hypothetical protein [Human adenovirus 41]|uniref:Uncharacterized protein n=1 Tax=Human adenovirus F serotype 41 TaxID=10524 RepID=A0A7U3RXW3_ADE41|nr:hypothetical protein [Human adenovirus 41]
MSSSSSATGTSGLAGAGTGRRRRRLMGSRSTKRSMISPRRRRMVSVTACSSERGRSSNTPPCNPVPEMGGSRWGPSGRDRALTMHLIICCVGRDCQALLSESNWTGSENFSRKASSQSQSQGKLRTVGCGFPREVMLLMR